MNYFEFSEAFEEMEDSSEKNLPYTETDFNRLSILQLSKEWNELWEALSGASRAQKWFYILQCYSFFHLVYFIRLCITFKNNI